MNKKIKLMDYGSNKKITLIKFLGEGTYSKVYKIQNTKTHPNHCIKIYNQYYDTCNEEADLLKQINNNNIIKIHSIIHFNNTVKKDSIILEYCKFNLLEFTNEFDIGDELIFYILKDITNALGYLKLLKILHLDVKQENILERCNTEFVLSDFSNSCYYLNKNKNYDIVTVYYRAPEICLEDYNYNYQVDVWSLGCVLYELLTKKILFEERFDILKRQIEILGLKKLSETFIKNMKISHNIKEKYYYNKIVPEPEITNDLDILNKSIFKDLCLKILVIDYNERITIEEIKNIIKEIQLEYGYNL